MKKQEHYCYGFGFIEDNKGGLKNMNNIMRYKGYWAKVQYSEEDDCFWGEIEGINDSISFEGTSVKELREDFEGAVNDYIDLCKKYNKEPQKQYNGSFNVRINPELHREASFLSKVKNISLNQFVERAIAKEVKLCLEE